MSARVRAFVVVGALGFGVQLAALVLLTRAGLVLPIATALAVEAAVLHNFWWHERWTWRDRSGAGDTRWRTRLVRFHSSNAMISIGVNVVLTWALARYLHLPAVGANVVAVLTASVANYLAADRWVFARLAAGAAVAVALAAAPAWAEPASVTLTAWDAYVRAAEGDGQLHADRCEPAEPVGEATRVTDGTIYRWSSCVRLKGTTVPGLVDALVRRGTPPPQEDVLDARVVSRAGDRMKVYLKLQRRAIVSVVYDTEHDVVFQRHSAALASSRSVATAIQQADGGDSGYLWRLNSYWTYRQAGPDVDVQLVSLSLSRGVPLVLRPVAGPIITRVARESLISTLEAVRRFGEVQGASLSVRRAPRP